MDATELTYGEIGMLCQQHAADLIHKRHLDAIDAVRRETWDKAIEAGVQEGYALASQHNGGQQLAVRMILEAIRGAKGGVDEY